MIFKNIEIEKHVVLRTCATKNHVDLTQHNRSVQMIRILRKKVLAHTSVQVMLENISILRLSPEHLMQRC